MKDRILIVADLGAIKAYKIDVTYRGTPRLELLETVSLKGASHRIVERITDFSGRRTSPIAKYWASPTEDESHVLAEAKRKLSKQIAEHIKRIFYSNGFSLLWLAAPGEINNLIIEKLNTELKKKIEVNIQRDFVKTPREKLLNYFAPIIREKLLVEDRGMKTHKPATLLSRFYR